MPHLRQSQGQVVGCGFSGADTPWPVGKGLWLPETFPGLFRDLSMLPLGKVGGLKRWEFWERERAREGL